MTSLKYEREMAHAKEIVKHGGFFASEAILKEEGIFDLVVEETKEKYTKNGMLVSAAFLQQKDWEIISMMDLFDEETLKHEIGVFDLIDSHFEKAISSHLIEEEEHLKRAAIHHDIGKMEIPLAVLLNRTTDDGWLNIVAQNIESGDIELSKKFSSDLGVDVAEIFSFSSVELFKETMTQLMNKKRIRAKDIVPVRYALSEEERSEVQEKGFSVESTLGEIIKLHEDRSGYILRKEGFEVEAEIAENHHNYGFHDLHKIEDINRSFLIDSHTCDICLADVLHIADIEQAMRVERVYKKGFGPFKTWSEICSDSECGKFSKEITYLWVKYEVNEMNIDEYQNPLKYSEDFSDSQKKHVETFLHNEEDSVWTEMRVH